MTLLRRLRNMFRKPPTPRPVTLSPKGEHYDLQEIYNCVNKEYFNSTLQLPITWSGSHQRKARSRRRLGSYNLNTKLIRIHRLMDSPHFPSYFISYVVYHEMLHHVCPPEKNKQGRRRVHHASFKVREKQFREYTLVKKWEKENLNKVLDHGRS